MGRIDMYKKSKLLRTLITFDGEDIDQDYEKYSNKKENLKINKEKFENDSEFYGIVKEMIFDIDEQNKPLLHIVCYTFNSSYNSLEAANLMTAVSDSSDDIDENILHELAMSIIYNIPVFPNEESIEHELIEYYNLLYEHGFQMLDDNNERSRYKLTDFIAPNFEDTEGLKNKKIPRIYSTSEISYYKNKLMSKMRQLDNAQYVINSLKEAIIQLTKLLSSPRRNENELQTTLTNYPILFGTEYTRVIDKHSFGSEYEADYVLERYNGLYDIVEIEASTLKLYTKQGNPRSELVHAEQQIMDWLEWIEHNNPYAREKIQELYSPKGYVVIGRSKTLTSANKEKLRRRNLVFRDKIEIVTYDDLLEKAISLLNFLTGEDSKE